MGKRTCNIILSILLLTGACESGIIPEDGPPDTPPLQEFPPFITPVEDYFTLHIGAVPEINPEDYILEVSGAVDTPRTFSLEALFALPSLERTLTIECIGNVENGPLLANAVWKGFSLYDLLSGLGLSDSASTIKYSCADGYFTYNTMDEVKNQGVLGALYMNDDPLTPEQGFPLRIIFPGYYGVRQPGWITAIEVLTSGPEDYWSGSSWKSHIPMQTDSRFLFPRQHSTFALGDSLKIGGAAFGAQRIGAVEISLDSGRNWKPAAIVREAEDDFTWVFWEYIFIPEHAGPLKIYARASAADGSIQPAEDRDYTDGLNSWPSLNLVLTN